MKNKPWINGILPIVIIMLVSANLLGCLPAPKPAVETALLPSITRTATFTPDPLLVRAFPSAEGFGAMSLGGRGGRVIEVTNLEDAGPGSFRAAVEAEGPRIVVFRLAGTISLQSSLMITHPFITIAGQTAPGQGITLRDVNSAVEALILIETHDVVIRYLALRAGPPSPGDAMMIQSSNSHDTYNVVIDHNSMSWAVNRDLATWYDVHDISIQWNIFSEGLNCSINPKGCHSKGALLGGYASDENKDKPGASNFSFHHNLMAHNVERNPLVSTSGVTDVVNNVVYNPAGSFSQVDMQGQLAVIPANYVGNYFKPGVDTDPGKYGIKVANVGALGAKIYVQGNIGPHRLTDTQPEINIVDPIARRYIVPVRNPAAPISTTNAMDAYDQVLADAGANMGLNCDGTFFSRRDAIDTRIVNDIINGIGKIIDDPSQVGGWLTISPADPCTDSDQDGMPDAWEEKYGFNPNDPSDANQNANGNGYTNIEEFLNGTDPLK